MKQIKIIAATAAFALMTACGNTAEGAKKDAENASEKAAEATDKAADATAKAAESSSEAMGAAMNTVDVKSALLADTRIKAAGINVDTNKDKMTVTLNGTVPSDSDRVLAVQVAKSKAPEYTVVNNLTIKKP